MTTKEMKTISFDGGTTTYTIVDDNAVHTSDVTSAYSSTGTAPINGTGVASALANSGFISGISSSDVTTALGYTPYDGSTNPNGYTTNTGTVTSVNNVSPVNGNVSLTIPTVPTALSSFTDDLGSSPVHTHSQYEVILKTVNVLSTSGTVALTDNSINSITPTAAVTFSLPTVTDNTKFHQILVQVNLSTVYTLTLGTSYFFNKTAPDMSNAGVYNLIYEYDKANQYWVVGAIEKGASA